jgi:hypothetical protein
MEMDTQATAREEALQVSLAGYDLINSPRLNKGTAFSDHERDVFECDRHTENRRRPVLSRRDRPP